jgi:predicted ArsR family transcriptional regulator
VQKETARRVAPRKQGRIDYFSHIFLSQLRKLLPFHGWIDLPGSRSFAAVNDGDFQVLNLIRENESLTINRLIDLLGVTATAVRQRLDRLAAAGLIQRHSHSVRDGHAHHRGRPSYRYELTEAGRKHLGNNLSDLAGVLWDEICQIEDARLRSAVLNGVIRRLAQQYGDRVSGSSLEERMRSLAEWFTLRRIPARVERQSGLPILNIHGCPYPDLAQHDRTICEMETELFSKLVGHSLKLGRCQDHGCCTFQTAAASLVQRLTPAEDCV